MMASHFETVLGTTCSYIKDIFINENIVPMMCIWVYLERFGLTFKNMKQLENLARVLSLQVKEKEQKT